MVNLSVGQLSNLTYLKHKEMFIPSLSEEKLLIKLMLRI